jgi:hypothetical protein
MCALQAGIASIETQVTNPASHFMLSLTLSHHKRAADHREDVSKHETETGNP